MATKATFAKYVKDRAFELNKSQDTIAKEMEVNPNSFRVYLFQGAFPADKIGSLAKALDVTEEELKKRGLKLHKSKRVSYKKAGKSINILPIIKNVVGLRGLERFTKEDLDFLCEIQAKFRQPMSKPLVEQLLKQRQG